jgi:hypothetical protein
MATDLRFTKMDLSSTHQRITVESLMRQGSEVRDPVGLMDRFLCYLVKLTKVSTLRASAAELRPGWLVTLRLQQRKQRLVDRF